MQGFLTDFFPWVKAGVKAGEQWADTSAKATTDGTDSVVVKRVTSYRVVGKDTRDIAEGAPRLERVRLDHGRHPAHAERSPRASRARGKGTGIYFVSPDGLYLGGDWQLQSALTIAGAFANEPLPITITQTTKVTALP